MSDPKINARNLVADSEGLYERIAKVLGGVRPEVQGATLAQVVAVYVAGHIVMNKDGTAVDKKATERARKDIFDAWVKAARELVPVMEAEMIQPRLKDARDR